MSGISKKLMGTTAAAGGEALAIEDVFSTYLYTGNGSTQTITNDIDLAGEGGLVWIKSRSAASTNHLLFDTDRGVLKPLRSNTTGVDSTTFNTLTAFNSDGFSLGNRSDEDATNASAVTYASWTFRKAPRFFDVVTYTGDGTSGRTVSHSLGIEPGCIIIKNLTTAGPWWAVYHRSVTATGTLYLNDTFGTDSGKWNGTEPTSSEFTVNNSVNVNASGDTYVAYLFAHDPLGPSGDGSDGLIACGSYTNDGSGNATVALGWEPQFVILKNSSGTSSWLTYDNMRGMPVGTGDRMLSANTSNAEIALDLIDPTATGFNVISSTPSATYIYIAIRRGPMRAPESGTEVFAPTAAASFDPYTVGFPTDLFLAAIRNGSSLNFLTADRLRGETKYLVTSDTAAEATDSGGVAEFDLQNSFDQGLSISSQIRYNFRRAPGFFDVVAYTGGNLVSGVLNHNLGAKPELVIIKQRNTVNSINREWAVGAPDILGINNNTLSLNNNYANGTLNYNMFNTTDGQTSTQIKLHGNENGISSSTGTYIAYLFATLAGVSKVGSYTGNGTSQTINCGFTTGARFVLIKRYDGIGNWYVFDSARGIVAGNDPVLQINNTGAEENDYDDIDPNNSGFVINQTPNVLNSSGATYIFLAIA